MNSYVEITETNFDTAVLKSAEPVLLDFWSVHCGPCKTLGQVLEDIAREQPGRVKIGKVDIEAQPELATRFGVQAVPTLLYFINGEVRQQTVGLVSRKSILQNLDRLTGQNSAASRAPVRA